MCPTTDRYINLYMLLMIWAIFRGTGTKVQAKTWISFVILIRSMNRKLEKGNYRLRTYTAILGNCVKSEKNLKAQRGKETKFWHKCKIWGTQVKWKYWRPFIIPRSSVPSVFASSLVLVFSYTLVNCSQRVLAFWDHFPE